MQSEMIWGQLLAGFYSSVHSRSPSAWFAIITGVLYVWYKSGSQTRLGRAIEAGISGLVSLALAPEFSAMTGYPPVLVHFCLAAMGFLLLDFGTSLFSDKNGLKELAFAYVRKLLGLKSDG